MAKGKNTFADDEEEMLKKPLGFANCVHCDKRRRLQNTMTCKECGGKVYCNDCYGERGPDKNDYLTMTCPKGHVMLHSKVPKSVVKQMLGS